MSGVSDPSLSWPFSWELAHSVATLIDLHTDRPPPSLREFREHTGVSRRRLKAVLQGLAERGVIEIEERGAGNAKQYRYRRCTARRGTLWSCYRER